MVHRAVIVAENGSTRAVAVDHDRLHVLLGGALTLCGAIPHLDAVAVCLEAPPAGASRNALLQGRDGFDSTVSGTVVLVGSDADGLPCDLDADAVVAHLKEASPPSPSR